jgi:hypothetical protein
MRAFLLFLTALFTLALSGCEAVVGIFEAGLWVGVIGVIVILAIVGFVVSRFRR